MRLRSITVSIAAAAVSAGVFAAGPGAVYSLDSCRAMALANNKDLMMSRQKIRTADFQKKEAFAAYLPALDFAGGYLYNQKNVNLLNASDYLQPVSAASLGAIAEKHPVIGQVIQQAMQNPQTAPLVQDAIGVANDFVDLTNNTLRKSTTYDIHNVFFGAVTLTQPIYMGGKIVAMNDLTGYARDLARDLHQSEAENVIYAVDAAYWQVVSLKAKRDLAVSFVNMLDTLDRNVGLMMEQGVATRADKLNVDVKLNAARVDLTKVENGLSLSRMALAQVCGMPIDSDMHLSDEPDGRRLNCALSADTAVLVTDGVLSDAYARRADLRALENGVRIAGAQKRVAMSSMLPNVALIGSYTFSNPSSFNGFRKRFAGAFSVGAMVRIPLWHWGGNYYKYKAAESDEIVMKYRLEDAREMVDLQINQAAYKARESYKTFTATRSNLASADENLRCANAGFREGVISTDDVLGAQTAWLKAYSENIDAMIDVRLCDVYLRKVLGTLDVPPQDRAGE